MGNPSKPSFSSASARAVLADVCREVGISSDGADLIRLGENAIFRLEDSTIIRIARGEDVFRDAAKEVRIARWLREAGIPAARLVDLRQPLLISGHPVTFWQLIPDSGQSASTRDLGLVLHRLHNTPVPEEVQLPALNMFGRVDARIQAATEVSDNDLDFLSKTFADLQAQYSELEFQLPPAAVHGDAHIKNLIRTPSGDVVLLDFERFAYGAPETDLAVTATEYDIGWHSGEAYRAFCEAYGFDVHAWSGFQILQQVNMLKMTTWLMQNVSESEATAKEFQERLATLKNPNSSGSWRPF